MTDLRTDPCRVTVAPEGKLRWLRQAVLAAAAQLVEIQEAEVLVWTDVDDVEGLRSYLAQGQGLRWIQLPWAGVEPFAAAGVFTDRYLWTCGKGVYAEPVAEHALALALAGLRDLKQRALADSWGRSSGTSLIGAQVTILGGGGITQSLIRLLAPFQTQITVVRRHPQPLAGAQVVGFDQLQQTLTGVDVLFLALALTPETQGVIGKPELQRLGPQAWIVNVARGSHIDTAALVEALQQGQIRGASLDVTDPEPLPSGHALWSLPNCLITPHTANTEAMAIPLLSARVTENLCRYQAGQPLIGRVDPLLGY